MIGTIDVKNEVRKLTSSKPVHAAAGVGVVASQTLRDLPTRIANLHLESTMITLPARANEVVQTARAKVVDEYEKFASRGRKALGSDTGSISKGSLSGSSASTSSTTNGTGSRSAASRGTGTRSTGSRSAGSKSKSK
jgi:hypothetical protein